MVTSLRLTFQADQHVRFQVQTNLEQNEEAAVPYFFNGNWAWCCLPGTGVFSEFCMASSSLTSLNATTELPFEDVAPLRSHPRLKKLTTLARPPRGAPG